MDRVPHRLFVPGDGALPPALTGRSAAQAVLARRLADLSRGDVPPHNIVLMGPRGNGKTALLNWFRRECETSHGVDVLLLAPCEIPSTEALIARVAHRRGIARLLLRKLGASSVGFAEPPARAHNFRRALLARCRRRPLALLVDEAHTLDVGVGGLLLHASQQVRAEAPFLLVLAGTPGLAVRLGEMDAPFWSRLGAGLLGIDRLDAAAARAALVEPVQANGVGIEASALEAVVEHSQGYPYFVQLWGDALWRHHLATGENLLAADAVAAVQPKVAAWVANYHRHCYRELQAGGLVPAAVAVALLLVGQNGTASERELDAALATAAAAGDAAARFATLESLNRLGYVWRPPGQQPPAVWYPGIPSLLRHVLDEAAALAA